MMRLIKTEFLKYKRYNIIWLGIASVLFSIILAAFQLAGTKNSIVNYTGLSEGVVWNHFSLFLPFTFTLVIGYSINREYTCLPVSFNIIENHCWLWAGYH